MEAVIHSCEFINAIQNDQLYMCKRWDRSVDAGISVLYERLCIWLRGKNVGSGRMADR
jgi:hypothetical protein